MKTTINKSILVVLSICMFITTSCSNNSDDIDLGTQKETSPQKTGNTKVYMLKATENSSISGTATFIEYDDNSTGILLELINTTTGNIHPAHIHMNSISETGPIAIKLAPVDGETGTSKLNIKTLEDGTKITYSELIVYDGYINIHLSDTDLGSLVAQGNIGTNVDNETPTIINYNVSNSGASAYVFNNAKFTNSNNPDLTLQRGETYTFTINTPGHPFLLNKVQGTGTGNMYTNGVTNNGATAGIITFTIPITAPNTIYYNCQHHGSMTGTIHIID